MGDAVDAILSQWQRERPDLDPTPMAVTTRTARLAALLERGIDDNLADHGLAGWEFEVLASLRRAGPPFILTVGRLQATMMISSGTMTHRLDRLEKRRLVARSKDLTDRRGIHVALTPDGRTLIDEVLQTRLNRERELLSALTETQQSQLADLLRQLLISLED
ncbi:DNA-binding MarR family transcriptional regulator [Kibdelosporangium banguiense]|uniref:DNA-binding MarR family transcriptional regulator n=1 Tax=Kibdelosporangium banguiense TaxID=1365924 RepID=A0ABS4TCP6_9PSEU|nr:MarR family transcriptional regulator [Kibdelosporangium banguiense]MBP2321623.1 DNA-binding MarR family transcriptional regulator [Kibdelosporangium banguiense]